MKNKLMIFIGLVAMAASVQAKSVVKEFKVYGQCGDCKNRIEKTLDLPGISFATWDVESKVLTVRYNDKKYSEDEIHNLIGSLGYATDKVKADKTAESNLPGCCQPKKASCCSKSAGSSCGKKK